MNDIERAVARLRLKDKAELKLPENSSRDTDSPDSFESEVDEPRAFSEEDSSRSPQGASAHQPREASNLSYKTVGSRTLQSREISVLSEQVKPAAVSVNSPITTIELPLDKLLDDGFLVPDTPKGRMTEEYRRVKRPLLKNIYKDLPARNSNVIMVTSSVSGEGKTYTAINLAMSFALERDLTVLLIDGDVIKGAAGDILGVSRSTLGLTDLLSGECQEVRQAILSTNVPSLSFLPAGSQDEHVNELLSSSNMARCINELSEQYRDMIIVMDCSPILQTNEANLLAEHAGQIVFVVAEADTPQKLVTQALDHIDKDKYVGILVNKSLSASRTYDYGYGYD